MMMLIRTLVIGFVFLGLSTGCVTVTGTTPLGKAILQGDAQTIQRLLDQGTDVNAMEACELDNNRISPIGCATESNVQVVQLLLDRGANVNQIQTGSVGRYPFSWTPLMNAVSKGNLPMVQLLLQRGADVNMRDRHCGSTALSSASDIGNLDIVQLLLEKGAKVTMATLNACPTDIERAQLKGHTAIVQLLLKAQGSGLKPSDQASTLRVNPLTSEPSPSTAPVILPIDVDRLFNATGTIAQVEKFEQAGLAAETSGLHREAFKQYLAAWEITGKNISKEVASRIHERLIKVAQRLDPPPAFPEEAQRHVVVGVSLFKEAKNPEDYQKARSHFEEAARLAPWAAVPYFNLGMVSDKLGDYAGAVRAYKLYLLASPNADDARDVQNTIYVLEEKAGISSGSRGK